MLEAFEQPTGKAGLVNILWTMPNVNWVLLKVVWDLTTADPPVPGLRQKGESGLSDLFLLLM